MLIYEKSRTGRYATAQVKAEQFDYELASQFKRKSPLGLPDCSELDVVRHYTQLSRQNFCIDSNFYPLGSCTMKYNPRGVHQYALNPAFQATHPMMPDSLMQGTLQMLHELQHYLQDVTGMQAVSLSPMAGSQGEFAGCAMIKAYHSKRGESHRNEMIVPDAAHGTNPASAVMCGFKVVEIKTGDDGDIDLDRLDEVLGPNTAGIMLTNPSTLGTFSRNIKELAKRVHKAGGLLYYDGANLNAILGKVRPGDMGFDVLHMNLHKTFATPHGGGGPGAGPVAVNDKLKDFLPGPIVEQQGKDKYALVQPPETMGRLSTFFGNTAILVRAYAYTRMLGRTGLVEVAEMATLNANYLAAELSKMGYTLSYPERRASHEFIVTLQSEKKQYGVTAMDVAKRLLDYGYHAPTVYFPLLVPECLLIEPTETESKETLDDFLACMRKIREEMETNPEVILNAPTETYRQRVDEVLAARELELVASKD